MKKTITHLKQFVAGLCLLSAVSASAQVATTYTFSQAAGTYTAITGTTIASNALGNMDDEIFSSITIPAFTFDGNTYTSVNVSTNGFITFGAAPVEDNYNPLSGTDLYAGAVSAFGQDLDAASSGTRNIRYQTVGSEFVIQWQNVARYDITGERISFQIRLNTSTNQIKIVYGGTITPGSDTDYMEIGLRGPDNTFGTNINNRKINAGTGAWINSVTGTNNGSTCYFNSATATTVPAVGATFTWTPAAVDMKIDALTLPNISGCYGKTETVTVSVRNVGGTAINFATTPLTLNVNTTGANPTTFTPVVISTGTLAVNATQAVAVSTSYDMTIAGSYSFNASASVTGDAHPGNDAAVITRISHTPSAAYADVSVCAGQTVTLAGTATAFPYNITQSNTTSQAIPDDDPTGINSTIVVSGAGSTTAASVITTINNIVHTFDGDLIIKLTAPDGSSMILSNQEGLDGAGYSNTVFTPSATTAIVDGTAPFTGDFLPEDPFTNLTGSANGTWTLNVSDNAAADVGTLNSWSLSFASANGIATYSWSPAGSLDASAAAQPAATPTANTVYTLTVTDLSGCINTDTVLATVNALPIVTATPSAAAVCAGASETLTGGGATTYTWDNSVSDNVAFTPSATTTYIVTGTDGNGCMNTASATVTVNPLPTVTAAASAAAVCEGDMETLTGGGANTYTWDNGVTDGVAFTPTALTTYVVTGTDGNGCMNTGSTTVTVNTLPTVLASASAAAVCAGGTETLSGGGAVSYTWDNSVSDGVAFTPAATTTYEVTGTDANGCMNTATTMVTVNTLPTVTAAADMAAVCAGSDVTLTGGGAITYTWDNSVSDGVAFAPTATTTYQVSGTDGNGCTNTATTTVTVNPLPAVDVSLPTSTFCISEPAFTLNGESPAGGSWSGNGVSGATFDPAAAGAGASLITYTYTDANGCTAMDTASLYVDLCTGIATVKADGINVTAYPNPVNSLITVAIANANADKVIVQITDVLGKEVYSQQLASPGAEFTTQIDVSSFVKGTYLLKVTTGSTLKMLKIIKE